MPIERRVLSGVPWTPKGYGPGMQEYFGEPWPSGVCDDGIRVVTPVGEHCVLCDVEVDLDDQGSFMTALEGGAGEELIPRRAPAHKECSLREVMGGIGHLENHELWCTQEHDPDAGLGRRQSALLVWQWVQEHGTPSL